MRFVPVDRQVIFTLRRVRKSLQAISDQIPLDLDSALKIAVILAVLWWTIALLFRAGNRIPVWYDQETTFTQLAFHLANPYEVKGFVNPPWTALLLAPFGVLPLPLATLAQLFIYFALLAAVIFKFGGNTKTVLLTLTSIITLFAALEVNLDWLVCIGLLIPPVLSGPFLLVKPQDALGYWISFRRKIFVRALLVMLVLLFVSLLIWGVWPLSMFEAIRQNSLGRSYNLAPIALLPWWLSVGVGLYISWGAFKRHDPIAAILGWLFFVPYITYYALLLPFGLFAIRYPRIAVLISAVMWIVFGGIIVIGILRGL